MARRRSRSGCAARPSTSSSPVSRSRRGDVVGGAGPFQSGRGTRAAAGQRTAAKRRPRSTRLRSAANSRSASLVLARACARPGRQRSDDSNRSRKGSSHVQRSAGCAMTTWVASSEWPPSSKKLSWMSDPLDPRISCPDSWPELPPAGTLRRYVLPRLRAASGIRRRQGLAVELAVGGQRQRVQDHKGGGHHVLGQRLPSRNARRSSMFRSASAAAVR